VSSGGLPRPGPPYQSVHTNSLWGAVMGILSHPLAANTHAGLLVLCYHALSHDWQADLSVTPARFAEQLTYLSDHGYRGVTFTEALTGKLDGPCVAITFDDGYVSNYELARPILADHGMPATVFVPTDYLGGGPMSWPGIDRWIGTPSEDELRPMSWNQARTLHSEGWELGSHTLSHPRLTEVPDEQLDRELTESRAVLERELGAPCTSLAFPYGDHDQRVIDATARAGYEVAGTLPTRTDVSSVLAWPRIGIYNADGARTFRFKVSPLVRRFRSSAAGPILHAMRAVSHRPGQT